MRVLACTEALLEAAGAELERKGASGVSLVDATRFVLMRANGIRKAFTFDYQFTAAGFIPVG